MRVAWQFIDRTSLRLSQKGQGAGFDNHFIKLTLTPPCSFNSVRCLSKPSKVFAYFKWGDSRTGKKSQYESQTVPPRGVLSSLRVRKTSPDQIKAMNENEVF